MTGTCISSVPDGLARNWDGQMWRACPRPALGLGLSPGMSGLTAVTTQGLYKTPCAAVMGGLMEGGCRAGGPVSWW